MIWFSPLNRSKQCVYLVWQVTDQGWLCVSGETLMENTPALPEGKVQRHPSALAGTVVLGGLIKNKIKTRTSLCVLCFPLPLSILWSAFSFLVQRHKNLMCISRDTAVFLIHVVYDLYIVIFLLSCLIL